MKGNEKVNVKDGVKLKELNPEYLEMCAAVISCWPRKDVTPVVTSANDGQHMKGSRHYTNQALDFRTKSLRSRDEKVEFHRRVKEALGPKFDVLLEGLEKDNEHLHIEVH